MKAAFVTDLANVTLTITASASPDLRRIVLEYDLLILPMFIEYERHSRLEQPLDSVDTKAVGEWIDERLIECVKVYLSLRDNHFYMNRAMVEDPISHARFLPEDAQARCEHAGKAYYFSSEQTFREFKAKHPPAPEAPPIALAEPSAPKEPKASDDPANPAGKPARK
jgi:YHS domain-containing protein